MQSSSVAVIADVPITIASSTKELWQVVVYIHCGGPHLVDDLEAAGAAHLGVHAYGSHSSAAMGSWVSSSSVE
ncbi:MAG: hypothetical protein IIY87_06030 [Bacteroidales bacterium]|nr:hypothetical protein [Bacteroidales bacterium]